MVCPHCGRQVGAAEVCSACGGDLRPFRSVAHPIGRVEHAGWVLRRAVRGSGRGWVVRVGLWLLALAFFLPLVLFLLSRLR